MCSHCTTSTYTEIVVLVIGQTKRAARLRVCVYSSSCLLCAELTSIGTVMLSHASPVSSTTQHPSPHQHRAPATEHAVTPQLSHTARTMHQLSHTLHAPRTSYHTLPHGSRHASAITHCAQSRAGYPTACTTASASPQHAPRIATTPNPSRITPSAMSYELHITPERGKSRRHPPSTRQNKQSPPLRPPSPPARFRRSSHRRRHYSCHAANGRERRRRRRRWDLADAGL